MEDLEKAGTDYFGLLRYIASLHIEACVSPVHDRDTFTSEDVRTWCEQHIDPDTGDLDMNYVDSAPLCRQAKEAALSRAFQDKLSERCILVV